MASRGGARFFEHRPREIWPNRHGHIRRRVHVARQPAPNHFRAAGQEENTRCLPSGVPWVRFLNAGQGRAVPDRPPRILLRVIDKSPKTVERAVAAG